MKEGGRRGGGVRINRGRGENQSYKRTHTISKEGKWCVRERKRKNVQRGEREKERKRAQDILTKQEAGRGMETKESERDLS